MVLGSRTKHELYEWAATGGEEASRAASARRDSCWLGDMDLPVAFMLHAAAGHGRGPILMMDSDGQALMIAADP